MMLSNSIEDDTSNNTTEDIASNTNEKERSSIIIQNVSVKDPDGNSVKLTTLWSNRKIVLIFLRHFGCLFCRQLVKLMSDEVHRLREANVSVVYVSIGTPTQAAEFVKEHHIIVPTAAERNASNDDDASKLLTHDGHCAEVYVDNDPMKPSSYMVLGLKRGVTLVRNERTAALGKIALEEGFFSGGYPAPDLSSEYTGDILQVGGAFVIGPGNQCDYAFRQAYAGQPLDIAEIVASATGMWKDHQPYIEEYIYPSTQRWVRRLDMEKLSTIENTKSTKIKDYLEVKTDDNSDMSTRHGDNVCDPLALIRESAEAAGAPVKPSHVFTKKSSPFNLIMILGGEIVLFFIILWSLWLLCCDTFLSTTVYTFVISCICAISLGIFGRHRLTSLDQNDLLKNDKWIAKANSLTLITPREIDEKVISLGCLNCGDSFLEVPTDGRRTVEDVDNVVDWSLVGLPDFSECTDLKVADVVSAYVREFLAKPHPNLGRKGAICPFIPAALRYNSVYISVSRTEASVSANELANLIRAFVPRFLAIEPCEGRKALNKAVIFVFPDVPIYNAHDVIDVAQSILKPEFVARGLMVGEFHLNNNQAGLRASDFYPLRTPFPSLAIRHMVPTDIVFLSPSTYSAATRVQFLQSFVDLFTTSSVQKIKDQEYNVAIDALEKAKAELRQC